MCSDIVNQTPAVPAVPPADNAPNVILPMIPRIQGYVSMYEYLASQDPERFLQGHWEVINPATQNDRIPTPHPSPRLGPNTRRCLTPHPQPVTPYMIATKDEPAAAGQSANPSTAPKCKPTSL